MRQPNTLHTAYSHVEAIRLAHLAAVSLAATFNSTRAPHDPPHTAGEVLGAAAKHLSDADQQLLELATGLWRNNVTGVTYAADGTAHHRQLRRAERSLDRAVEELRALEPSGARRGGMRAAAARLRSTFVRRPWPEGSAELAPPRGTAPAATPVTGKSR
ncbi:hypothetical protein [Kitasatospora sp. NPDC057015]|uniref:hypothetical protein n=1 Tax=Kitasatospora sp. NPDC057015 TaxID=3346001 RepID=UPI0036430FAE